MSERAFTGPCPTCGAVHELPTPVPPPQPLAQPDFSALIRCVTGGVAQAIKDGYEDEDLRSYIYEAAMEAVYGPGYWPWRRSQKW